MMIGQFPILNVQAFAHMCSHSGFVHSKSETQHSHVTQLVFLPSEIALIA